jgi:hypothetical protein
MYTGDTDGSLAALRQDVVSSYRAICNALGEPQRTDLVNGSLPAAAALGLALPAALPTARLPPLLGGPGLSMAPLLLLGPPPPPGAAPSAASPGQNGSVAMGLGPSLGIEAVGSGADAPARLLSEGASSSAAGPRLAGSSSSGATPGNGSWALMGAGRSLSAGHAGLPPLGSGRGADRHWPMGRPGGYGSGRAALGGRFGSGGGGDGARITMLSGFRRPQVRFAHGKRESQSRVNVTSSSLVCLAWVWPSPLRGRPPCSCRAWDGSGSPRPCCRTSSPGGNQGVAGCNPVRSLVPELATEAGACEGRIAGQEGT